MGWGQARQEVHLFRAPIGKGKTWWLITLGVQAGMQGYKVLHVTLELSPSGVFERCLQIFSTAATHPDPVPVTTFSDDAFGRLVLSCEHMAPSRLLTAELMTARHKDWRQAVPHFLVKPFPTGQLTIQELERFLDTLKRERGFIPDLLTFDHPCLMTLDPKHYGRELAMAYEGLHHVAVSRNLAVATVASPHPEGSPAEALAQDALALDVPSTVLTYRQTVLEAAMGVARLRATKVEHDYPPGEWWALSQCYSTGQFCIECRPLDLQLWEE